jgi:hypothetical protein
VQLGLEALQLSAERCQLVEQLVLDRHGEHDVACVQPCLKVGSLGKGSSTGDATANTASGKS